MPKQLTAALQALRRMLPLVAQLACAQVVGAAALNPAGVDRLFVTPDEPSVLQWNVESGELADPVPYTIRDYWGRPVAAGQAKLTTGNTVEAAVKLGQGFYDLELPATNQRFGVVSLPAYSGARDPFFAIDSALSWLVRDDKVRQGLIKVLRRSGVATSRERLSWSQINPAEGTWNWEGSAGYEAVRRMHAEEDVEVLEMFHDAPGWPGKVGKYPQDLVATAGAWRRIAARWRPTWGALEIWNEPDISFGANLPADQYVPLVKTIAYASWQERIDLPLVGGVFAHCNRAFLETAAAGGMLDCVDAVSFHTYARASEMEALIGDYRSWLRAHGRETVPLWLSECGRPWKRGPDRPPVDQDAASALDITMKAVEARAGGVARHFPFVYPYYEEGDNNFGMMGRRATPLRSMAAYARLVSLLAHKRYLGDLKCDDQSLKRSRVFGDDRETVVVLYTSRPDAQARLKLDLPVLRTEGIDGRRLEAAPNGSVPIPDGLTYVWLDRQKLGDRLQTDTPAMRLWEIAQQAPPRRPKPSPMVLRFEPDPEVMEGKSDGYHLSAKAPGKLPLRVRVFNLSAEPHELTLKLDFSQESARLIGPQALAANPPAEGFADVVWESDLSGVPAGAGGLDITVTAADSRGGQIAPLVIRLVGPARLTQAVDRRPESFATP